MRDRAAVRLGVRGQGVGAARRLFVVVSKVEGQVLGAFDPSGQLVGFCLALPALKGSLVYLHSHMLAVLPRIPQARSRTPPEA